MKRWSASKEDILAGCVGGWRRGGGWGAAGDSCAVGGRRVARRHEERLLHLDEELEPGSPLELKYGCSFKVVVLDAFSLRQKGT